ncbi:nicotinate-nucleotide--dimethylbenzimidazole phosphoribosyltransferase [Streptomyces sp. 1331.2]|uniref:nicotinate-nucleotide--dimethylbenzimidazole phosphoribosyltransferase n=1 Tax=Streptomyces sp. 1331.2 TaxID=1938835 RepID=UPI000BCE9546|nr:nicotinate-nucleotide--dimethylbenzimidazole phosphoribosyltransferase [Streptomyces sp. 1331.2]SOB85065.1 nicotinate-nucleotide-dimethylbenzimidazole phosphoribosyltransferase /cob(II)yrinic acid a,c-diamide reductase [Streptomyces sp. 1331.2]
MTDGGHVPGEGLPEHSHTGPAPLGGPEGVAGVAPLQGLATDGGAIPSQAVPVGGMPGAVPQGAGVIPPQGQPGFTVPGVSGVPSPGVPGDGWALDQGAPRPAFHFLDQPDGLDDEDDVLLMPGPQGSWGEPVATVPADQLPLAPQQDGVPVEPSWPPVDPPVLGAEHVLQQPVQVQPSGQQPMTQAQQPRRPLHAGPPIPDPSLMTGQVPVRSLADRGPSQGGTPAHGIPVVGRPPVPEAAAPAPAAVPQAAPAAPMAPTAPVPSVVPVTEGQQLPHPQDAQQAVQVPLASQPVEAVMAVETIGAIEVVEVVELPDAAQAVQGAHAAPAPTVPEAVVEAVAEAVTIAVAPQDAVAEPAVAEAAQAAPVAVEPVAVEGGAAEGAVAEGAAVEDAAQPEAGAQAGQPRRISAFLAAPTPHGLPQVEATGQAPAAEETAPQQPAPIAAADAPQAAEGGEAVQEAQAAPGAEAVQAVSEAVVAPVAETAAGTGEMPSGQVVGESGTEAEQPQQQEAVPAETAVEPVIEQAVQTEHTVQAEQAPADAAAEPAAEAAAETVAQEPEQQPVADTAPEAVTESAETAAEQAAAESAAETPVEAVTEVVAAAVAEQAPAEAVAEQVQPAAEAPTEAPVEAAAEPIAAADNAEPAEPAEPGQEQAPGASAAEEPQAEQSADQQAEQPAAEQPSPEEPQQPQQPEPQDQQVSQDQPHPEEPAEPRGPAAPGYDEAGREAVHQVIRERRDIRNGFRPDPIPHEVLIRVLEAAHTAPSVGYSQPWDFVVIRSRKTRKRMHALAERQREAYADSLPKGRAKQFKEIKIEAILETPVNIVVTADRTRGGRHTLGRHTQPQMAPYSAALAVENLWLAARAEGLGVGWVSFFDDEELVRELGLPEHLEVVAYLCVGFVDSFPGEPELEQQGWAKKRPLSWVVHEEQYGNRALPGEEPQSLLADTLRGIRPLDAKALGEAWDRQKRMTKPAGSLGMLEIISAQLSGLSRKCPPPIPEPACVAIFAGDHGVHAQGVSPWPQEVTAQMVGNFLAGGAVINSFAKQIGTEVCVVDVGVAAELPDAVQQGRATGLLPRKVRPGTGDMTQGPAMTREEALQAIEVGIETARDLVAAGNKALVTGDMGIANTTASAALISVFTGLDPAEVTGRGTGIDDETHAHKIEVIRAALALHRPDPADPIGVLAAIGGLEHAAIAGFLLGAASLRTPVILDGVIAGSAALVAKAIAPEVLAACIAGHRSAEPGHQAALAKLGLRPLIDLDLRLGEGTGALLALPLVQSAARAMHDVATFDSAGVTEKA